MEEKNNVIGVEFFRVDGISPVPVEIEEKENELSENRFQFFLEFPTENESMKKIWSFSLNKKLVNGYMTSLRINTETKKARVFLKENPSK